MWIDWRQGLNRIFKAGRQTPVQRRAYRPALELLEDRWVPAITATSQPLAFVEGASSTLLVATFTDTTPSLPAGYTADIDWGDGTPHSAGAVTLLVTTFSVTGTHTYADETTGGLNATVVITETGGDTDTATVTDVANVDDALITASPAPDVVAVEGTSTGAVIVGTFVDANPGDHTADFTVSIDWGDSPNEDTTTGTITFDAVTGVYTVKGTHTYTDEGSYAGLASITDKGGESDGSDFNANVDDAILTETNTADLTATEGVSTGAVVLGTFTDANPGDNTGDFSVSIDWGDSPTEDTTTGTVTFDATTKVYTIKGTHTYGDEGNYAVLASVTDVGGESIGTDLSFTVNDAAVAATAGANINANINVALPDTIVAKFTDAFPGDNTTDFTAVVNWGDNTGDFSSAGANPTVTVVYKGDVGGVGTYEVHSTHTYATASTSPPGTPFLVKTTITDVGASTASATLTANVFDNTGGFTYDPATKSLTIVGRNFTFSQVTTLTAGVTSTVFSFTNQDATTLATKTELFSDKLVIKVTVTGSGFIGITDGIAQLITNDTFAGAAGTSETVESIALGTQADAGAGVMSRADASGVQQPFLTLSNYPVSYAYAGRADGSVLLFGTAGLAFNGFVTAGNFAYMGGPSMYHEAQGASSVYGYSSGQATDFAFHYMENVGSFVVFSGTAFSYMSGTDTVNGVTNSYFNVGAGFSVNTGFAKNQGQDIAYFIDSPQNDTFSGFPNVSFMLATDSSGKLTEDNYAAGPSFGFALVFAQSFVGGTDTADIFTEGGVAPNIVLTGFAVTHHFVDGTQVD